MTDKEWSKVITLKSHLVSTAIQDYLIAEYPHLSFTATLEERIHTIWVLNPKKDRNLLELNAFARGAARTFGRYTDLLGVESYEENPS